jgi:hypothetical protein
MWWRGSEFSFCKQSHQRVRILYAILDHLLIYVRDLWYNTCVYVSPLVLDTYSHICREQQAFGRVHRIGQKRETHLGRLVVDKSVDSRLLASMCNLWRLVIECNG